MPDSESVAPLFSVIINTLNRAAMLRRALESVRRQTFRNFEIIVVDDGSTEDIESVTRDIAPAAKFIRLAKNRGIPSARNVGLAAAAGRYIAFLDSDDVWHPRYLHFVREAYAQIPDAIFTFTEYMADSQTMRGPVAQLSPEPQAENAILHMILRPFIHTTSSFAAPREGLNAIGGFNEKLPRFSDLDCYVRLMAGPPGTEGLLCEERPVIKIPQILVRKDIHLADRSLEEYQRMWRAARMRFLDTVFAYDFMKPYQEMKQICAERLAVGEQRFFSNFKTDATASAVAS
jgi:glycosyltransferase involved in cell wall biosynthesis